MTRMEGGRMGREASLFAQRVRPLLSLWFHKLDGEPTSVRGGEGGGDKKAISVYTGERPKRPCR